MSRLLTGCKAIWLVLLAGVIAISRPAQGADSPSTTAYLADVRVVTSRLLDLAEGLQEDIVDEISGTTEQTLFKQADALLEHLTKLQSALKPGADRAALYGLFDQVDKHRVSLAKAILAVGPMGRPLQREMERINAVADELAYVLAAGDTSENRKRLVLVRQVNSLASASRSLSKTAQVAFGGIPGRGELQADLKKLSEVCEQLAKTCSEGKDRQAMQKLCVQVNLAWDRVVQALRGLSPRENVYLIRGASRVDTTHDRIFQMLEMPGVRPKLVIGS